MKPHLHFPHPAGSGLFGRRRGMWASALVIAALGVAGCAGPNECATNVPPKSVENFFSFWSRLAPDIKRVVVLPIACDPQRPELLDGCTLLQPILETELTKTGRFEVVPANAESLCIRTGSDFWTGSEVLPNDFLTGLREQYGCDAVLFCQLTEFRSYSPLAVGWRMRLVEVRSRQTLWAVDEMFDGGNASVLSGATQYQAAEEGPVSKRSGHWPISVSPRRFAQYAAAQILATLPER